MSDIPPAVLESLTAYVNTGRPPGGCLEAILSNDLMGAFGRADDDTAEAMRAIVIYIYNRTPATCHGSPYAVRTWIENGGLGR